MKKNKLLNIILTIALILSAFGITPVYAASATVGFSGNSTVAIGDEITINLYVSNVSGTNGGVTSVGGNLTFDSSYLEYISGSGVYSGYTSNINTGASYKLGGFGAGINGSGQTNIFTFKFKALKAGTTQIGLSNAKVSDDSGKFEATIQPKQITIGEPTPSKSSDATLKSLAVTGYTISPAFNKNTTNYTVTVPNNVTKVTLTGERNDTKASVEGLGEVTLSGNSTTATVKVTAEDGTPKTYTVKINKESSSNPEPTTSPTPTSSTKGTDATLKSLVASGYTLSPEFDKDTTSYTVKVPTSATTVKLEGTLTDTKATVTGLGNVTLDGDATTATIKVTSEDGKTTKSYTVKIVKEDKNTEAKDSDATLKKLDIGGYTLTPTFKKNVNTYSMKVKSNIDSLDVTAIPTSDKAKVDISGNKNWKDGVNVVTVKVTAEDGTVNTYTINVTKGDSKSTTGGTTKSTDNTLKSLIINSSHEITPKFSKNVSSYNVTVPYSVDKLDFSYTTNDSKAKVKVTGNENFKVGEVNVVEIEVTAEDGSIRTYTLNVTRSTGDSDNDLKELVIEGVKLSPSFDKDVLEYTAEVPGNAKKLDITAKAASKDSKVQVIGNENLKEGHNTILVKVTDKDGFTKYYTIDAVKEAKSNTLFGLTLGQFGLIIGFLILGLLLLLLLLKRRKEEKVVVKENQPQTPVTPVIEVKPEFNFGSKNSSDDDVVYGNMNQDSTVSSKNQLPEKETPKAIEAQYEEIEDKMPFDPYDETVTKKEIIAAIHEATKTKDPSKLKMLLEQDEINQKRKELRKQEKELENRQRKLNDDDDDWR